MSREGRLEAIWIKRAHSGVMDGSPRARLVTGKGLEGSADQGGKRQVTIIEREIWDRVTAELGSEAEPSTRRANLMVSGLPLAESRGRTLQVGETKIRIHGETKPCNLMEESVPGLRQALYDEWKGGAFGEVEEGGEISVGDAVGWAD